MNSEEIQKMENKNSKKIKMRLNVNINQLLESLLVNKLLNIKFTIFKNSNFVSFFLNCVVKKLYKKNYENHICKLQFGNENYFTFEFKNAHKHITFEIDESSFVNSIEIKFDSITDIDKFKTYIAIEKLIKIIKEIPQYNMEQEHTVLNKTQFHNTYKETPVGKIETIDHVNIALTECHIELVAIGVTNTTDEKNYIIDDPKANTLDILFTSIEDYRKSLTDYSIFSLGLCNEKPNEKISKNNPYITHKINITDIFYL